MDPLAWGALVGVPLAWHLAMAGYAYVDADRHGMDRRKWGTVALLVPFFGFFAYVFERDERTREPDPEFFTEGPFRIHESRAGEPPLEPGTRPTDGEDDPAASSDGSDR